jgi:hypothetical protein
MANIRKKHKLTIGQKIRHHKYGEGVIIDRWGNLDVNDPAMAGSRGSQYNCFGIFDAAFTNEYGMKFRHSAVAEYFTPV